MLSNSSFLFCLESYTCSWVSAGCKEQNHKYTACNECRKKRLVWGISVTVMYMWQEMHVVMFGRWICENKWHWSRQWYQQNENTTESVIVHSCEHNPNGYQDKILIQWEKKNEIPQILFKYKQNNHILLLKILLFFGDGYKNLQRAHKRDVLVKYGICGKDRWQKIHVHRYTVCV